MAGMVYRFRPGYQVGGVEAQVAGDELEKLRVRSNGILTPRAVIEEAKPASSPLHPVFEWDDAAAAEKHREWQARNLIAAVAVILPDREEKPPVRAFLNVKVEEQQHYTSLAVALSDEQMRTQVLAQAMRELQAWRQRYCELQELARIFAAIDAAEVPD